MKKLLINPFYLNGLKQNPKDTDFNITPSLVFGYAEDVKDIGFAYGLGIKWGFWAVGVKLFGVYNKKS